MSAIDILRLLCVYVTSMVQVCYEYEASMSRARCEHITSIMPACYKYDVITINMRVSVRSIRQFRKEKETKPS